MRSINKDTAPVEGGCNTAIGGQGQSGCMWPVYCRSSSGLWISIHTLLKHAATQFWPGLVKQVLPSRDSCWLASANGVVASLSLGEGRMALQTIVLPRSCSSSGAARGSLRQRSSLRQKGAAWRPCAATAAAIAAAAVISSSVAVKRAGS